MELVIDKDGNVFTSANVFVLAGDAVADKEALEIAVQMVNEGRTLEQVDLFLLYYPCSQEDREEITEAFEKVIDYQKAEDKPITLVAKEELLFNRIKAMEKSRGQEDPELTLERFKKDAVEASDEAGVFLGGMLDHASQALDAAIAQEVNGKVDVEVLTRIKLFL